MRSCRVEGGGFSATPGGKPDVVTSALGLMARCEGEFAVGDRLRLTLPVVGVVAAEVRWSLGGRVGCQLDQPIALSDYYALLAVMARTR